MKLLKFFSLVCWFMGTSLLFESPAQGQAVSDSGGNPKRASDIYPESGNRLPLVTREELDDLGKKLYDLRFANSPNPSMLQGPGGLQLYSPKLDETAGPLHHYLRYEAIDRRLVEVAILVVAREFDQQFEWVQHEYYALKDGLEPEVIDVIRYRKPVTGLGEKEAAIIELGRELFRTHKVSSDTFARASKLFSKQELVNVVSIMGQWTATAILLTTFDQQLRPGQKPLLPIP